MQSDNLNNECLGDWRPVMLRKLIAEAFAEYEQEFGGLHSSKDLARRDHSSQAIRESLAERVQNLFSKKLG